MSLLQFQTDQFLLRCVRLHLARRACSISDLSQGPPLHMIKLTEITP
jgi:hypothetical protein